MCNFRCMAECECNAPVPSLFDVCIDAASRSMIWRVQRRSIEVTSGQSQGTDEELQARPCTCRGFQRMPPTASSEP